MKYFLILVTLFSQLLHANPRDLIKEAEEKKIPLSEEDKRILSMGEISQARYITGGILGTYPLGFGLGHTIQGTWRQRGWIFTAGEGGSLLLLLSGLRNCEWRFSKNNDDDEDNIDCGNNGTITIGLIGFLGFKIWEIVDLWSGVPQYRRRQQELKNKIQGSSLESKEKKVSFFLSPFLNPKVGVSGLNLTMTF